MSYIGRQNLGGAYRQLDDISSGFDGSDTTHTMQVNSQNVTVGDVNQIILSLGGVIQKPGTDFTVSGSVLTFTTAPASGLSFFAVLLGSDNGGTVTPTDASVTSAKLSGNLVTPGTLDVNGQELILDADADTSITADTDDQIDIKVGGADKVSITSSQAKFTQTGDTDVFVIESTSATAETSPDLVLFRNSSSPADDDTGGNIIFRGRNDNSQDVEYASITGAMPDVSDGSEDGKVEFAVMTAGTSREYMKFAAFEGGGAETVFNDGQVDINLRVESDNNSNMLRVDAGTDCVIVGANARTGDERFLVHSAENQTSTVLNAANNSYSQDVIDINCNRSGTSSFNFVRMMSDADSGQDSEFIFAGNGNAFADGTYSNNGADYAEFFETNDGNSIDVGKTVVLDGNKVKASTSSDDASTVIGVVRPKADGINSMIIGNTAWNRWTNKYLHDDYGSFIMEDYTVTEWKEDGQTVSYKTEEIPSDVTVPSDAKVITLQRRKRNPDFDEEKTYKPRSERDEWVIIGMLGQIQVTKGQKTGTNWIKMRDISDTVEEWLVR